MEAVCRERATSAPCNCASFRGVWQLPGMPKFRRVDAKVSCHRFVWPGVMISSSADTLCLVQWHLPALPAGVQPRLPGFRNKLHGQQQG